MIIVLISQPCLSLSFATTQDTQENQIQTVTEDTETTEEYVYTPMSLSFFGIEMIKSFEGFYSKAYWDYRQWTIGYGSRCEEGQFPNGITEAQATELMKEEMPIYVNAVNNFIKSYELTLTQNQFDALVSFSYNCGQNVWKKSTDNFTLKKLIVEGNWNEDEITAAFGMWNKAGGEVLDGLTKRRAREAALFNSDINIQSSSVKWYFVSTNSSDLVVRPQPGSSKYLGEIKNTTLIPVVGFSSDGKWASTPHAAYFGWVSTSYIKPVDEAVVINNSMLDSQGVKYTLGTDYKNIIAGVPGGSNGNALYSGLGEGNVYLSRYIKSGDYVYQLTKIADKAFYANTNIKTIYIPDSVKSIADNAFTSSSLEMIYCSSGSYAATYAKKHGIPYMEYACRNGHSYNNSQWKIVREVNCTQDGLEGLCCDNCGYVSETRVYKEKLGGSHTYVEGKFEQIKAPSCEEAGLEAIVCSVCNAHVETRVLDAFGHTPGDWETVSTVSCTTDGVKVKKCTVCHKQLEEDRVAAFHTYDANDWKTVSEPTCTAKGEKAVLCTICSAKVKTQSIAAKGHNYGEWYTKSAPTYLKEGELRRDCDRCTHYDKKSIAVIKTEIVTDTIKLNKKVNSVEGIIVNTKVSDILSKIENSSDVKIIDRNGIELSEDDYVGSGSTLVLFEGNQTLLSYSFTIKGDADGNGQASDWDCILLARYLAGWEVDICVEALDFDKNGKVNDWDEILFSRYLASWNVKLW